MVAPEDTVEYKLGEISGQLRELNHSSGNNGMKLDAIGLRVAKLEEDKNKRDGGMNVIVAVLKSPLILWVISAVVAVYAYITSKGHV